MPLWFIHGKKSTHRDSHKNEESKKQQLRNKKSIYDHPKIKQTGFLGFFSVYFNKFNNKILYDVMRKKYTRMCVATFAFFCFMEKRKFTAF